MSLRQLYLDIATDNQQQAAVWAGYARNDIDRAETYRKRGFSAPIDWLMQAAACQKIAAYHAARAMDYRDQAVAIRDPAPFPTDRRVQPDDESPTFGRAKAAAVAAAEAAQAGDL